MYIFQELSYVEFNKLCTYDCIPLRKRKAEFFKRNKAILFTRRKHLHMKHIHSQNLVFLKIPRMNEKPYLHAFSKALEYKTIIGVLSL